MQRRRKFRATQRYGGRQPVAKGWPVGWQVRARRRRLGAGAARAVQVPAGTLATVAIGGSDALPLYVLAARALKFGELRELTGMLRARLQTVNA